jgi:hypothetical protein
MKTFTNLKLAESRTRIFLRLPISVIGRFSPVITVITSHCTVGGFNVSNLMGIKRRMIDIGKKKTFYFLQKV